MCTTARVLPTFDPRRLIVGDAPFVEEHAPKEPPVSPVARIAFDQARPPIGDLVDRLGRDEAIRQARLQFRYTIREIALAVGCSTETVRRRLRSWDVRT